MHTRGRTPAFERGRSASSQSSSTYVRPSNAGQVRHFLLHYPSNSEAKLLSKLALAHRRCESSSGVGHRGSGREGGVQVRGLEWRTRERPFGLQEADGFLGERLFRFVPSVQLREGGNRYSEVGVLSSRANQSSSWVIRAVDWMAR